MKRLVLGIFLFTLPFSAAAAKDPKTFVYHAGSEPSSLDPHITSTEIDYNTLLQLFEGLVVPNPDKGGVSPGVAERWTVSPDGKTYTFYLRKNAKWSDGSSVTTNDFVYSWERAANPKTASPYATRFDSIKNGQAYVKGELKDPKQLGFRAIDDWTFQVELVAPFPPFLDLLCHLTFTPIKKSVVEAYGDQWARPEHWVSNGAFVLKEWMPYDRIVLTKNPHYWNRDRVALETLIGTSTEDLDTVLKQFDAGELDFSYHVPQTKIPLLRSKPNFREGTSFGLYYYPINVKHPVLQDARIRRALALAIDRKTITEKVMRTGEAIAEGYIPPGVTNYRYQKLLAYNPQQAKQLLAEAGYADGKGFPELTLSYNTVDLHRMIAEAVQRMWKENLGITVNLVNRDWKTHIKTLQNHDYDLARMGFTGDYIYPSTILELFLEHTPNNYTQWSHAEYERLWKEANKESDGAKRLALYAQMEKIIGSEIPGIPIFFYANHWMVSPKVKGLAVSPLRNFLLKNVSMK
ncbi:MAG: peptide ABC transporter substrate-binding protein [Deltaproteobacteria bacterium]|nr:peptide ABC transporter substrate-binding protein [Deltaproteobacteria bacterium]